MPRFLFVFMVLICTTVWGQAILLDTSFASNGQLHCSIPNGYVYDYLTDVTINNTDELFIAGSLCSDGSSSTQPVIRKYSINGLPDNTYGLNSIATIEDTIYNYLIRSITVDSEGRAIIVGEKSTQSEIIGVAIRFTTEGHLDSSFAVNGVFEYIPITGAPLFNDVELQSDGSLIILSSWYDSVTIISLTADGQLSADFGNTGTLAYTYLGEPTCARNLSIDSQDRIVVAGTIGTIFEGTQLLVSRVLPNGIIDSAFAWKGHFRQDVINDLSHGTDAHGEALVDVAVGDDNKIYYTGIYRFDSLPSLTIRTGKLTVGGSMDNTFNDRGYIDHFVDRNINKSIPRALTLTSNQELIGVGKNSNGSQDQMFLYACSPFGESLSPTNTSRIEHFQFANNSHVADVRNGVTIQSSGRILSTVLFANGTSGLVAFTPNFAPTAATGINEESGTTTGVLYPNPATTSFTVQNIVATELVLYNSMGQLVQRYTPANRYELPNEIPNGNYFLQITTKSGISTATLVVER